MINELKLETEFSREELEFLFSKENREIRYGCSVHRRIKFKDDSINKLGMLEQILDWEMEQILLESQFTADEFYDTAETECPDPRTRPFVGTYCYYNRKLKTVRIFWYRPRPFNHPRTGKKLCYGKNIAKGSNYFYRSTPFRRYPAWVQATVKCLEERNARKRRRVEIIQKLRTLIKQYRKILESEYY